MAEAPCFPARRVDAGLDDFRHGGEARALAVVGRIFGIGSLRSQSKKRTM